MMIADVFVVLDTVPFNPRHEENRARIRAEKGARWLTVPMHRAGHDQLISDTRLAGGPDWTRSVKGVLEACYRNAPLYGRHADEVLEIIDAGHETLTEISTASWEPALRELGIECRFVLASDLPPRSRGTQQLVDLCRAVEADRYVSGGFGRDYLDRQSFADAGIEVRFHEFDPAPYPQAYDGFVPFLSYLDAMFNVGLDGEAVRAQGTTLLD
jgi:hypothetical protein